MTLSTSVRALAGASIFVLGTVLAWTPQPVKAQGFAGTGTVDFGTATIDTGTPGVTNINLPVSSPRATITWTPSDSGVGGGPIDFLPNGNIVNYTGDAGESLPYTILNRVIPVDPSRSVAFNGIVNSNNNVRVFFYSPGGLLIGSTARFNVGGLLLSTSDLVLDGSNDFMPTPGQFSVAGAAGSTSAIEIQAGAEIRAEAAGQSNFIVAVAPRIQQDGLVSARGSVALVAAESADFAVDNQGLFNITVSQGSEVSTNTFSHTGTTGGPDAAGGGEFRRVYMVAVPKNNAISMAIQSGGAIGFDIAGAADVVGNRIILSAGHNIADSGAGNPIVATQAGVGPADVTVQRGAYTSNTFVRASGNATVTDSIVGGTPDISFASDLSVQATSSAVVNAAQGSISVGGDLTVSADAGSSSAGMAFAGTELAGTALNVTGALIVTARDLGANPFASIGGIANVETIGGTITVGGPVLVSAAAEGADSVVGSGGIAFGGQALINASGGGTITVTAGDVVADAFADGGLGADNIGDQGGNAFAGTAHVAATGAGSAITVANAITADAQAVAGDAGGANGQGGTATGGTAEILATGGTASVNAGDFISTMSSATGGNGSLGGNATGGTSQLIAENGSISTVGAAPITVNAQGSGGAALGAGSGGSGTGGVALVEVRGAGSVEVNRSLATWQGMSSDSLSVNAGASGGGSSNAGGIGGAALGGQAKISIADIGGQITVHGGPTVNVSSDVNGGGAFGGGAGGSATGGLSQFINHGGSLTLDAVGIQIGSQAQAGVSSLSGVGLTRSGVAELIVDQGGSTQIGGNLVITSYSVGNSSDAGGDALGGRASAIVDNGTLTVANSTILEATTIGGNGSNGLGGNAEGGLAEIRVSSGGIVDFREDVNFFAFGMGGNGTEGRGGNAIGGQVLVTADSGTLKLASVSGGITVDTSVAAGTGLTQGTGQTGSALVKVNSGATAILGVAASAPLGSIETDAPITLTGNTKLLVSSAGSIEIAGTVTGTGDEARLALQADNQGSGTGTVVFGGAGSVNLSGAQATVDIYHNPTIFGTPTDYSSNIAAGTLTAYQLVHNAGQLQSINSHLNESFALARDVDVGSLAIANAGTGFQPLGDSATQFTGKFDGQGYSVRNLFINRPGQLNQGLFGNSAGATIQNLNVLDATIIAGDNSAVVIGQANGGIYRNLHAAGKVDAASGNNMGGLIGALNGGSISDSSSATTVTILGGTTSVGGLVGYNNGSISRSWSTGNVTFIGSTNGALGGLVGYNDGNISQTYATGAVTGTGTDSVGGLVGHHGFGTIDRSYAIGDVLGNDGVGGLVGHQLGGTISETYASGAIIGTTNVGGLVGNQSGASASITNSYWDNFTTGQTAGFGAQAGTISNLNAVIGDPGQSAAPNYAFSPSAYANFSEFDWTNFGGESRPIGAWEITRAEYGLYTIRSAHQLQFVQNDLAGNYRLAFDINAFELQQGGSVLGGGGFIPIGDGVSPFTGQFDGAGHVVSTLYINRPTSGNLGLFAYTDGTIRNLGLVNVAISGGTNRVGALAGTNTGLITGSFATGIVTGTGNVTGGLVGENSNTATITQSYASVDVTGANTAGGLVGLNAGTISFSFANGSVTGTNAGGLIGTNATLATVADSYWDTQTSGLTNACGTDDGTNCGAATGLSTAQSRQAGSYVGWSLDTVGGQPNIWRIYEGASTPLLKAFLRPLALSPLDTSLIYNGLLPTVPVVPTYADPTRIFGTATLAGLNPNVGVYGVTYVGGLTSNQLGYDLVAGAPGTLTITPATITVNADAVSRLYGDTDPVFTYSVFGLRGADTLSGALSSTANIFSGIGSYAITQGTLANPNYSIAFNSNTLNINPRPLSVTADIANRLYGDANPVFTYTVGGGGLVNGDTLIGALSSLATVTSNVGGYAIDQGTLAASANYALTYNSANLDVLVRPITVTGDTLGRLYGDANPALTYSVGGAGLVNGDLLVGSLDTLATATSNVGAFAVTQGSLSASTNYALTYVDGSLNVTPRTLTITADPNTRLYGDANPAFAYAVGGGGLVNGDTLSGALDSLATVTSNIGVYAIDQGTLTAGGNYAISYISDTLTVTPRALSVTADPTSRLYGDANPAFTFVTTGLVNGDMLSGVLDTAATVTSNIGSYGIDQGTLSSSANYVLSYTGANLDVLVRPITVTGDTLGRLYGDANPALTYNVGGAGLVNGDTLTGTVDTLANLTSNIGAYGVTQGTLAASANYALAYVDGTLNVTPRPLSVVADLSSRVYGDTNPAFTYSSTGLVNGDTLSGSLDSLATVTSNVGTYSIDQATLSSSANYILTYTGANLSVTPRALTITADPNTRLYGDVNPAFTYAVSGGGLVNGDTLSGALGSLATVTSNIGAYAIDQGTLTAGGNYAISYVSDTLTVTPRALSVTADSTTRLYGDANPAFTFVTNGLVNGDTLSGALDSLATVTSNIGSYGINQGTLASSANYVLSFNGASLSVAPRPLSVTADPTSRLYGDANPAFTFASAGLVNGDVLTGALNSVASVTSNVGGYGIDQGTLAASSNYALTYNSASLGVLARPITVTGDALTRLYGDVNPTLTYIVGGAGLVNGDALSGGLGTVATVTSNVGTYATTQGTLSASTNYALTIVDGSLGVTPRPLTIVADSASRLYGDVNPAFTYSATGLVNGDSLAGALVSFATVTSNVGAYTIDQGSLAASANYALAYTGANLSVTPRPLTVAADSAIRLYGDANPAFTFVTIGLVNGDTLSGSLDSLATLTSNIGSYGIDQGTLFSSANYALSYTGANLDVLVRPISVTGDALSRLYGDANPALTYTVGGAGLVNGDLLSGALDSVATVNSNIGAYATTQGSLAASSNYAISYTNGSLSVTPRPLSITADALARDYGDANPALSFTAIGLVNGDLVSGALSTSAGLTSNVGSYGIVQGTLSASTNYVLNYNGASLSVTPRSLTITADAQSRFIGNENPALTYGIGGRGLVNGDVLTGGLSTAADQASPLGSYAIGQGSLAATPNYSINYVGAILTVTPCDGSSSCAPPPAVMEAVSQIGGEIQQQSEEGDATEEAKEEAAAQSAADPEVLINSVIDTSAVNKPIPVNEPVSGSGNATFWTPGEPQ